MVRWTSARELMEDGGCQCLTVIPDYLIHTQSRKVDCPIPSCYILLVVINTAPHFFYFLSPSPPTSPSFLRPLFRDALFFRSLIPFTRSLNNCHCRNGSRLLHRFSRSCCRFCRLRPCYPTQKAPPGLEHGRSSGSFTPCPAELCFSASLIELRCIPRSVLTVGLRQ